MQEGAYIATEGSPVREELEGNLWRIEVVEGSSAFVLSFSSFQAARNYREKKLELTVGSLT